MHRKKSKRSIIGLQTKKRGALYEKIFRNICQNQGAHVLRIEDGARVIPIPLPPAVLGNYKGRRIGQVIRAKQPFDFIVNFHGKIIACDVKTTDKKRLSFSYLNKMIKDHQMLSLLQLRSGCLSGLFFFFMESSSCVFFDVNKVSQLKPRNSLVESDGILLGNEQGFDLKLLFT